MNSLEQEITLIEEITFNSFIHLSDDMKIDGPYVQPNSVSNAILAYM